MSPSTVRRALAFLIATSVGAGGTAAADPVAALASRRVRVVERHLGALLQEGLRLSATLRALVTRLERSDLVVYVMCDGRSVPRIDGRLTLMGSTPGARYVMVRIRELDDARRMLAIVGHELQHAVEIADTPAIADADSMAREFLRIGYSSRPVPSGPSFETRAAVAMGLQVWRELQAADAAAFDDEE